MWVQLDAPTQQQEQIEREARATACGPCTNHVCDATGCSLMQRHRLLP